MNTIYLFLIVTVHFGCPSVVGHPDSSETAGLTENTVKPTIKLSPQYLLLLTLIKVHSMENFTLVLSPL